jgi:hypothetical protein
VSSKYFARLNFWRPVITYKRSSTNAPRVSRAGAAIVAVSRADNRVGIHERTTAEVSYTSELDADDEGEIALGSSNTTNNVRGVLFPVGDRDILGLGQSSSRNEGRNRKSDENGLGEHVGDWRARDWEVVELKREASVVLFKGLLVAPYL